MQRLGLLQERANLRAQTVTLGLSWGPNALLPSVFAQRPWQLAAHGEGQIYNIGDGATAPPYKSQETGAWDPYYRSFPSCPWSCGSWGI